jgi:hypothetical protein
MEMNHAGSDAEKSGVRERGIERVDGMLGSRRGKEEGLRHAESAVEFADL